MPDRWRTPANVAVLAFLDESRPSAHSDIADEFQRAAAEVGGLETWCPDPKAYAFVMALDAEGGIIAVAHGMRAVELRLPFDNEELGASPLGADWVTFNAFDADVPRVEQQAFLAELLSRAAGR